jgi:dTDP-4-amino-4,6-dideoxygalactose transaminase
MLWKDFSIFINIRLRYYHSIIMLSLFKVFMSEDVIEPVNKVLMSGYITQGKKVEEFESALSTYLDQPRVLTLNSATAGLTLALRLLKNPTDSWPGFLDEDEVLTPALTCFATTSAILSNGANIKWLDVDPNTANIDFDDLKNKLSPTTKAIYIVHWGGCPVNLDKLKELQEHSFRLYGFKPMIIEDCAHAFGAEYNGRKIGNGHSDNICVFSLQAIKHLTTGDGGIITLPTQELYDRCKLLRWYGIDRDKRNYKGKDFRMENDIVESGYKFHMNDINATIGLHNLPHIDRLLEKDRANAAFYNKELEEIDGVTLLEQYGNPAYWLYTMRVTRKEEFINFMKDNNIMASQVHNRNDINSCVSEFRTELPNLDVVEQDLVCIPVGWWLEQSDLDHVVAKIREFFS